MFAEAMYISVVLAMNSNVYKFDNTIRVQTDGGGMGVRLTGILAEFKMTKWCQLFSRKLGELQIDNDFLERFVDA